MKTCTHSIVSFYDNHKVYHTCQKCEYKKVVDFVENEPTLPLGQQLQKGFLTVLKNRFDNTPEHYTRPANVTYKMVQSALEKDPTSMYKLYQLEKIGGEIDVMALDGDTLVFAEMSKEAPEGDGRRNINYQQALELLQAIGVTMMTPKEYKDVLQTIGQFDENTYVLLQSEADLLERGSALVGYRYVRGVYVRRFDAWNRFEFRGVRGVLRVKI